MIESEKRHNLGFAKWSFRGEVCVVTHTVETGQGFLFLFFFFFQSSSLCPLWFPDLHRSNFIHMIDDPKAKNIASIDKKTDSMAASHTSS